MPVTVDNVKHEFSVLLMSITNYIIGTTNSCMYLNIPNIDPMETRQSMFDDPSKGSKHTTYLPRFSVSI